MRNGWVIAGMCLTFSACGISGRPSTSTDGFSAGGDMTTFTGYGEQNGGDVCSDSAKLIYVVDHNGTLSSFQPGTLTFTDIGVLNCPAASGATPFSMSVDRTATAWVGYSSSEVFKVDTKTGACSESPMPAHQSGFDMFGMGFVSNSSGSNDETLFIAGGTAIGELGGFASLGSVDPKTLLVTNVGNLYGWPELSGTGDANLWGFFPNGSSPRISKLDKTTGAEGQSYPLSGISAGGAWAFAQWGGDFWIFLGTSSDGSTQVHLYRPGTGMLTTPVPQTGRTIVGAGVSTCAPTVIQ